MRTYGSEEPKQLQLGGADPVFKPLPGSSQRRTRRCHKGWMPLNMKASQVVTVLEMPKVAEIAQMPELSEQSDQSPLERWMATEDLWLRLSRLCPVTVRDQGGRLELVFANFHAVHAEGCGHSLAALATDVATYQWSSHSSRGSLVWGIDCGDGTLVLQLTDLKLIERWSDGEDLVWQVQACLRQLQDRSVS